jgi:hypothetical protein
MNGVEKLGGGIVSIDHCRMLKKAVQQGRSEPRGESYFVAYVEPLSDARTPLTDFFSILLGALDFFERELFGQHDGQH